MLHELGVNGWHLLGAVVKVKKTENERLSVLDVRRC